jgi:hypothetical protein
VYDPGALRLRLWTFGVKRFLARDTLFPLRVESYTVAGKPIESVEMTDPRIDVAFPDRFFTP